MIRDMYKELTIEYIRNELAKTPVIYTRGENLYHLGGYALTDYEADPLVYRYGFNGNYGEYEVTISGVESDGETHLEASCTCPYPHGGCKHIVAASLDLSRRIKYASLPEYQSVEDAVSETDEDLKREPEVLTPEEIRQAAIDSRWERAEEEEFRLIPGNIFKGQHVVRNDRHQKYTVTIYDTSEVHGHCTCPDYAVNHLDVCKHLIFAHSALKKTRKLSSAAKKAPFPFIHLTWSSRMQKPVCFYESIGDEEIQRLVEKTFTPFESAGVFHGTQAREKGSSMNESANVNRKLFVYTKESIIPLYQLLATQADRPEGSPLLFDDLLIQQISNIFSEQELKRSAGEFTSDYTFLKTIPYPYQKKGIEFSAFRKAAIIADEMGLGKTLQAITTALIKKEAFGFTKTLIVCPASLKSQWEHEIAKFTDESALVISGTKEQRKDAYLQESAFFKITNYEALLRDITTVEAWEPDFVILDEAQRIKNFETKTHRAINRIPRIHSLVITGTPLENKLEDLYSIVQFSDPNLLTPLWAFAATHYRVSREKKNKIVGYRNLDIIHDKLKPLLIRRTKQDVFDSLPEIMENTYYLNLHPKQEEMHQGFMSSLLKIVTKKYLTPMDIRMLQKTLLCLRMVCNSTFLIDKETNYSPKLAELSDIFEEVIVENGRKAVIFTEWTTMTYLIGNLLTKLGIGFVEFSGKVPVKKRQQLIDEFRDNPECMVFLSTDAGGVGLNLQHCDFLINVELPWNPARLNQRIGRIHRIGQTSKKLNVINLISRNSIEEKVLAGISMKQDLFDAVLEGKADAVDFSREEQNRFLNQVRALFQDEIDNPQPAEPLSADDVEEELGAFESEKERAEEAAIDIEAEETADVPAEAGEKPVPAKEEDEPAQQEAQAPAISYDQLEAVLNQGLSFLNTLTAAATGKELFSSDEKKKQVEVDREKGEVILRFKL